MKNNQARKALSSLPMLALAAGLILTTATLVHADKGTVTIKSTIKTSTGNEPGTLKGVVGLRLVNPQTGPAAPDSMKMTFDISVQAADASDQVVHFKLSGTGKTRRGKETVWRIRRWGGGLALWVDGKRVDFVGSPMLARPRDISITVQSSPFDGKANPYGAWHVVFSDGGDSRTDPPVVLVPNLPSVPIPPPIPPVGG